LYPRRPASSPRFLFLNTLLPRSRQSRHLPPRGFLLSSLGGPGREIRFPSPPGFPAVCKQPLGLSVFFFSSWPPSILFPLPHFSTFVLSTGAQVAPFYRPFTFFLRVFQPTRSSVSSLSLGHIDPDYGERVATLPPLLVVFWTVQFFEGRFPPPPHGTERTTFAPRPLPPPMRVSGLPSFPSQMERAADDFLSSSCPIRHRITPPLLRGSPVLWLLPPESFLFRT